jgi:nucleoside-diphosphate-sugar epimerase
MSDAPRQGVALITGASGFIGSHLRERLIADGYDVVALTRAGSPEPKQGRAAPVDYEKPETLQQVLEKERPELLFHVAGVTKGVTYADFERGNVTPTQNLIDAARKVHPGLARFVHVSSLAAYGPSTPDEPAREHHERTPVEHYGKSKLAAERAVESAGEALAWTVIRPPAVYGPADVDNFELFRLAARRLNVFYGNRDRPMSFVFVDDLVRGIVEAAVHPATRGQGYFLTDGRPRTWGEYQAQIVAASGQRALHLDLPEFLVDVAAFFGELATKLDGKPRLFNRQKALLGKQAAWTCSDERAREHFGYESRVEVEEGVERTFQWYRERGWL